MVTQAMLVQFGRTLRAARKAKNLSQGEVAQQIYRTQGQYSDIERAYVRPGQKRGAVPDDEFLQAVATVLDLPLRDLHAALGRVPDGTPAVQLVREKAAAYGVEQDLDADVLADLSSEVEDFAAVRVRRQLQRQGRQLQVQG